MEHPMRLRTYSLRSGSGGSGRYRGGDGIVREYQALERAEVSVISERRKYGPAGAKGGNPGQPGVNSVNGSSLGGRVSQSLEPGDVLRVETPGGGGWGQP
jgi:N-methylhydantoinase B